MACDRQLLRQQRKGDEQAHLVVVVEASMHRAIIAMMFLLRRVRHELGIGMYVAVRVVALMLAEVRRHTIPSPALVPQRFPSIVVGTTSSNVHLFIISS